MATFTRDWFSHNINVWQEALSPLKDKPIHALEVGCFEGRATIWLLENILLHQNSRIMCVDPYEDYREMEGQGYEWDSIKETFLNNIKPWEQRIDFKQEHSTPCLKRIPENTFDLIYIDGDHTSRQNLIDAVLSHLLLKKNGIIIFDDYMWANLVKAPNVPRAAIDAFMECFADQYNVLSLGYQVILKKK